MLSRQFYKTVVSWCKDNGMDPKHLLMIMYSESGLIPRAAARNKNGAIVAAGISQIQPSNFAALGYQGSAEEFIKLTGEQQLPYTFKYMVPYLQKGLTEAHYIYACNFLPARCVGEWKQDGYTLCGGNGHLPPGKEILQWAYDANRALDHNRDGFITMGDMRNHLQKVCSGPSWDTHMRLLEQAIGVKVWTWKNVQSELAGLGFYNGKIDGVPGPLTCAAMGKYFESQ